MLGKVDCHIQKSCLFLLLRFPTSHFFFVTHSKQDSSSPFHCSLLSQGDQKLPSCQTNGQFWLYFTLSLLLLPSLSSLEYYLYLDFQRPQFSKFSSAVMSPYQLFLFAFSYVILNINCPLVISPIHMALHTLYILITSTFIFIAPTFLNNSPTYPTASLLPPSGNRILDSTCPNPYSLPILSNLLLYPFFTVIR